MAVVTTIFATLIIVIDILHQCTSQQLNQLLTHGMLLGHESIQELIHVSSITHVFILLYVLSCRIIHVTVLSCES